MNAIGTPLVFTSFVPILTIGTVSHMAYAMKPIVGMKPIDPKSPLVAAVLRDLNEQATQKSDKNLFSSIWSIFLWLFHLIFGGGGGDVNPPKPGPGYEPKCGNYNCERTLVLLNILGS
jgi:hypothetical protein